MVEPRSGATERSIDDRPVWDGPTDGDDRAMHDGPTRDRPFADDELERLALGATPFDPFADDVTRFDDGATPGLLPEWYMPAPSPRRSRSRTIVLAAVAASLVVVNVGGFCVTYGFPEFVWN